MSNYTVSIRGPVPPDVAQRIAEAHAQAIRAGTKRQNGQPGATGKP